MLAAVAETPCIAQRHAGNARSVKYAALYIETRKSAHCTAVPACSCCNNKVRNDTVVTAFSRNELTYLVSSYQLSFIVHLLEYALLHKTGSATTVLASDT